MKNTIVQHKDTNNVIFVGFAVSFPHLIEPTTNTANPDKPFDEYSADILIPKTTDLSAFDKVLDRVIFERWKGNTPDFRYPSAKDKADNHKVLKDGDKKLNKDGEVYAGYAGNYYITVKASVDNKPLVRDMAKNELTRRDAITGGDICSIFSSVYAYGKAGNNGIGFGVNTVRLDEKTDKPFGGGITRTAADSALDQFADYDDMGI